MNALMLSFVLAASTPPGPVGAPTATETQPETPSAAPTTAPTTATVAPTVLGADTEAPNIVDVAAAAANPAAAPAVTVMMSDRGSGVGEAFVVYRATGTTAWQRAPLNGPRDKAAAPFVAMLPDGLQLRGFEYYIEATDSVGNGPARIGSADSPIVVERAVEATQTRIRREVADEQIASSGIHPAWPMLALGTGILASAGTAAYLIDLTISQSRQQAAATALKSAQTPAEVLALTQARDGYKGAVFFDAAIATVLGVVAVAGLATGVGLLVAMNLE